MMKICIIGYGFVGKAMHTTFEHNADVLIIDPLHSETTIEDIRWFKPSIVFVCLPAPTLADKSVDISLITGVFSGLAAIEYNRLVVLKSTLPPTAANDLYITYGNDSSVNKHGPLNYIYSPEFLRQDSWAEDALDPTRIILAGPPHLCDQLVEYYKRHSHVSTDTYYQKLGTDYTAAALAKYAINTFLATKVVFMNQLYQLYADITGSAPTEFEWQAIVNVLIEDPRMGTSHFNVPGAGKQFGYGGACFPKDVSAMIGFDANNRMSLLAAAEEANLVIKLSNGPQHD
jgi:UDPglucose 6-dehydrogenase